CQQLPIVYKNEEFNLRQAARAAGKAPRDPKLSVDLRLAGPGVRAALREVSPAMAEAFEQLHPAYAPFPAPAHPEKLPADDAGRRGFLVRHIDGYLAHENSFDVRRAVHGRGHAVRAYIFATALCGLLEEQGVKVDRNAVLMGIAGHDVGREGSGADKWEAKSAAMTAAMIGEDFGEDAMGEDYAKAMRDCVVAGAGGTVEAMILKAADSLDIGRTATFELERFPFLKGAGGEKLSDKVVELREELAREADVLQRLTDPYCQIRDGFEYVMRELALAEDGARQEALQEQIAAFNGDVAAGLESMRAMSAGELVALFESRVAENPGLMPLLSRYCAA
ncbi:MAG: hypothetical protein HUK26_04310, partial [Duodenibacillus sp.]|nr:hypothetical protein [Duodenibacillus sp.]